MKKKKIYLGIAILLVIISGCLYFRSNDVRNLLAYGLHDWPTHEPASASCPWKSMAFEKAGVTAFVASCIEESAFDPATGYAMTFSDADKKIIGKWATNSDYEFIIEVITKEVSQNPLDIVNQWYTQLTPEQKKVCEIQNADEPLEYFHDGRLMWTEDPHPMPHKTRYKIDIKPEISRSIFENSEPGATEYDYLCGQLVGSKWSGHPPYFEFDDRNPDKYLFVGTYGLEGPMIDLNSIRF